MSTSDQQQAKTLLQIAGANLEPSSLKESAVILIDMQNEYLPTGNVPLHGVQEALDQGEALLKRAREQQTPVIHVVHHGGPNFYDPQGTGGQLCDQVKPIEGEPVVAKKHVNAFVDTDMLKLIEATGRKKLIVAGFMTHMCVSTFVRAAVEQYKYPCTVVAAATAARALPVVGSDGKPTTVPAQQVHDSNLAALNDFFASVVPGVNDIKDE